MLNSFLLPRSASVYQSSISLSRQGTFDRENKDRSAVIRAFRRAETLVVVVEQALSLVIQDTREFYD